MKIVCISDTHGFHNSIKHLPAGDVLIHSGDFSRDSNETPVDFLKWMGGLPYMRKVLIAGNHDFYAEKYPGFMRVVAGNHGVTYLNDSGFEINGVKFWGSPVQPRFGDWAFNRDRGEKIKAHWDLIPNDTDVLITHGPAFRLLDLSRYGGFEEHCGCRDLYEAILRVQPKVHAFGHIHGSYGHMSLVHDNGWKTMIMNSSCCDESYEPNNPPQVYELP